MTPKQRAENYMRLKQGYKEKVMRNKIEQWIIKISNWLKESSKNCPSETKW